MARGNGNRGGGDRILESRHLVGFFLGVVLLCGVFFTLGYTIGRNDYSASAANRDTDSVVMPPKPQPKPVTKQPESANSAAPANNEWDFYTKQDQNHLDNPAQKPSAPAPSVSGSAPARDSSTAYDKPVYAPSRMPVHYQPPKLQKNSIVLQLSATRRQSDAMALADELQQKKFPSFVVTPTGDNFYRVQVGPYSNEADAEAAKRALDREGFKAIIKR
jgi:DedD protein